MATIIAGSSAGEHDLTADVVAAAGELWVHGIDVMPGKPAVLGTAGGKPVIGFPGYPVSAIVIAREILKPGLEKFLGCAAPSYPQVRAVVPKKLASHLGLEEFIRVTLGRVGEKLVAVPLARGAGVITTMVHADGLLRIPSFIEGLNAGEEIEVEFAAARRGNRKYDSLHGQSRPRHRSTRRPTQAATPGTEDRSNECR